MDHLNPTTSYGELLDKRDNRVYRTLVISNHVWTAQNMNFKMENDSTVQSWCYDNELKNCDEFGRLYNWNAAQKACPDGWHLPTAAEWLELLENYACNIDYTEDEDLFFECSGNYLKSTSTWNEQTNKDNSFGFSVTAAGTRLNDMFLALGETAFFWSTTDTLSFYAYAALFLNDDDSVFWGASEKNSGLSVRCVKGKLE